MDGPQLIVAARRRITEKTEPGDDNRSNVVSKRDQDVQQVGILVETLALPAGNTPLGQCPPLSPTEHLEQPLWRLEERASIQRVASGH